MAFDFGYIIALGVLAFIIASIYKKKTGNNISELWKKDPSKAVPDLQPGFQRFKVTRGAKL